MHRSGHMQVETVFQPRELDLNGPDFAEGHRSYEQCVAEAHRIASPRARSEDEAAKTRLFIFFTSFCRNPPQIAEAAKNQSSYKESPEFKVCDHFVMDS